MNTCLFLTACLSMIVSLAPTIVAMTYSSRWVTGRSRMQYLTFVLISIPCFAVKYVAMCISIETPMASYPYISELTSYVYMLAFIVVLRTGLSDFALYICLPSLVHTLPSLLLNIPMNMAAQRYMDVMMPLWNSSQAPSHETILFLFEQVTIFTLANTIITALLVVIMHWLYRKLILPQTRARKVLQVVSFLFIMTIKVIAFFAVLYNNGYPTPDLKLAFLVEFYLLAMILLSYQLYNLFDYRYQKFFTAQLIDFQNREMASQKQMQKTLLSYLDETVQYMDTLKDKMATQEPLDGTFRKVIIPRYSENVIADTVLAWCDNHCRQAGITLEVSGTLPVSTGMDYEAESSLYFNILSNCLDAAAKCPAQDNPFIRIHFAVSAGNILIQAVNSIRSDSQQLQTLRHGGFLTSKADRGMHGYGSRIIRDIVTRYGGDYSVSLDKEARTAETVVIVHQ